VIDKVTSEEEVGVWVIVVRIIVVSIVVRIPRRIRVQVIGIIGVRVVGIGVITIVWIIIVVILRIGYVRGLSITHGANQARISVPVAASKE
jgi:hypothetical protein